MSVAAHQAGIRALLDDGSFGVFFDPPQSPESLPVEAFPYVVVYLPPGLSTTDVAINVPHRLDIDFRTVCVALPDEPADGEPPADASQMTWIRDRVTRRLAMLRPVVDGRDCTHIEHIASLLPTDDSDVPGRRVLIGGDSWTFVSRVVAAA